MDVSHAPWAAELPKDQCDHRTSRSFVRAASSSMREVNMTRPPLLPPCARARDKASALRKKGIGPPGWNPHWFRHSRATALLLGRNRGVGGIPTVGVTRTLRRRWTFPAWFARTRHCVRRRTGRPTPPPTPPPGSCTMIDERPQSVPDEDLDPVARLRRELPAPWRGPVIGPASKTRPDHRER